jgi:hypothetical protein
MRGGKLMPRAIPATTFSGDEMTKKSNGNDVKIRVTKLGGGRVSTGVHVAVEGETMAQAGDMLTVPQTVADELEARGLAETQ